MKREPPSKSQPLCLHSSDGSVNVYSNPTSPIEKGLLQEGNCCRFSPKYDNYQGVLKRVSDMKLSGSLDSEEPSTESEKSESSNYRVERSKRRNGWGNSSCEGYSGNGSACEDESSSSFGGSDHCPPYEEITAEAGSRCSFAGPSANAPEEDYMNLPLPPPYYSHLRRETSHKGNGGGQQRVVRRSNSSPTQYTDHHERVHIIEDANGGHGTRSFARDNDCDTQVRAERRRPRREEKEEGRAEGITDIEKHQIESFFRGLRTDLFVCSSLANLYVGWKDTEGKWAFKHTGVPVILLDRGDTKSRSKKKIQILLAERGTCFPLWKDTIDNLTSYRKAGEAFHTMYLSSDHRQVIGLSFDSSEESDHFYDYVNQLTSNPENINISVPGSKKNKKGVSRKLVQLPHKDEISNPCLFEHVTSVVAKDTAMYMSLQTLLDKEFLKQRENIS